MIGVLAQYGNVIASAAGRQMVRNMDELMKDKKNLCFCYHHHHHHHHQNNCESIRIW